MLGAILRELIFSKVKRKRTAQGERRRVLNVGGSSKQIPIPGHYQGWEHVLLDIDPRGRPDLTCDARDLRSLGPGGFDAVYCSHNLEHYYRHDGKRVLAGFLHIVKEDGFVEIRVPDLKSVFDHVVKNRMDLGDVLYHSSVGPISVLDVVFGLGREVEESGKDFYAHKTGFTPKLMHQALKEAGFAVINIQVAAEAFELRALAFKKPPQPDLRQLLRF